MHNSDHFYLLASTIVHGGIALAYAIAVFRSQDEGGRDEKSIKPKRLGHRHIYACICVSYACLFSLDALECHDKLSSCTTQIVQTAKDGSGTEQTRYLTTCAADSG